MFYFVVIQIRLLLFNLNNNEALIYIYMFADKLMQIEM